jgi:low affinity Fe/Cu permease
MQKQFAQWASVISHATGHPMMTAVAVMLILVWFSTGPYFGWSELWHLLINSPTTVITFLMVFVIQNQQRRSEAAIQAKLDCIIEALDKASNQLIGVEEKTEDEIQQLRPTADR